MVSKIKSFYIIIFIYIVGSPAWISVNLGGWVLMKLFSKGNPFDVPVLKKFVSERWD